MAECQSQQSLIPPPSPASSDMLSLRFYVQLVDSPPIVSYKKLLKESLQLKKPEAVLPAGANPALEARLAPLPPSQQEEEQGEKKRKSTKFSDASSNRFSSVIERIERLYKGRESDEETDGFEEDAGSDRYDSDDPFIDDQDLDEYFTAGQGKTKYTGFFVNKGALERVDVPSVSPVSLQKPKKRKIVPKLVRTEEGKVTKAATSTQGVTKTGKGLGRGAPGVPRKKHKTRPTEDHQHDSPIVKKASAVECKSLQDQKEHPAAGSPAILEVDAARIGEVSLSANLNKPSEDKILENILHVGSLDQQKAGSFVLTSPATAEHDHQKSLGKRSGQQDLVDEGLKTPLTKASSVSRGEGSKKKEEQIDGEPSKKLNLDTHDSGKQKVKGGSNTITIKTDKPVFQTPQQEPLPAKKLSSKMLEKAIIELQALVPSVQTPGGEQSLLRDVDLTGSQASGRMPRISSDVKSKLGHVARLAAREGSAVPLDVVERLKDIMKPMMQPVSLKKHLKSIIEKGQTAREMRVQRLEIGKKELKQLVEARVNAINSLSPSNSRLPGEDVSNSTGVVGNGRKLSFQWDASLEERVSDVYTQFAEGLVENKGTHLKRFYTELAALWPEGMMDNAGIKEAITRVTNRKKAEKVKTKKKIATSASGQNTKLPGDQIGHNNVSEELQTTVLPKGSNPVAANKGQAQKRKKKGSAETGAEPVKKKLLLKRVKKRRRPNVLGGESGGKGKTGSKPNIVAKMLTASSSKKTVHSSKACEDEPEKGLATKRETFVSGTPPLRLSFH